MVSPPAVLAFPEWLPTGYAVWRAAATPRGYLLGEPTADLAGMRDVPLTYSSSSAVSRRLLQELPQLMSCGELPGPLVDSGRLLLSPGASAFWSEHGDRATLPTWAALAGVPREDRDFLGRWSAQASDAYVRASEDICKRVQSWVALQIRKEPRVTGFFEKDLVI